MYACIQMTVFMQMHRAPARSEKKRSGIELSWRDSPTTCKGQSPQREEAKRNRAVMAGPQQHAKDKARSEKKRSGIELAWLKL